MNNKIIGYEEAVDRINKLSELQRHYKRMRWISSVHSNGYHLSVMKAKKEINMLLSIIDAHKKMRKMYEELRFQKRLVKHHRDGVDD